MRGLRRGRGRKVALRLGHGFALADDRFPEMKGAPTLTSPDGKPVAIHSALVQQQDRAECGEPDDSRHLHPRHFGAAGAKPALAVNLPREESDLAPIDQKEIPKSARRGECEHRARPARHCAG